MLFFFLREVAGWGLIVAALFLVRESLIYVESRQVIEAGVLVMAAASLMRGGTFLIRASTAARICQSSIINKPGKNS